MIKFKDSNFLTVPNHPEIKVGVGQTIPNGGVFTVSGDTTVVPLATDKELFIAVNVIDKPDLKNTNDFQLKAGDFAKAYRMKDLVGLKFDMDATLVSDAYSTITVGETLVPDGTKWKVGTIATGGVGFEVYEKNTFGMFTTYKGTDVAGGLGVKVVLA